MSARRAMSLAALAAFGVLLSLYQVWYIHLPLDEAALFDLCRVHERLDCFRSLARFGRDMTPFGIPVFAALASLFLLQLALALDGMTRTGEALRRARFGLAGVLAFPEAGLALYVLLHDLLVAEATSPSALLVAATAGSLCVLAAGSGVLTLALRPGALGAMLFSGAALLAAWSMHRSGVMRTEIVVIEQEREASPPSLRWSRFAIHLPREGAARLGNLFAEDELVLFVDPSQEESRALMRAAADLKLDDRSDLLLYLYAEGAWGEAFRRAQSEQRLAEFLRSPTLPEPSPATTLNARRQQRAIAALGITAAPAALWRGGRKAGAFTLAEVIAAARAS